MRCTGNQFCECRECERVKFTKPTNDVYMFGEDDPVTCPDCGWRCEVNDDDNWAKCPGCKKEFQWEVELEE